MSSIKQMAAQLTAIGVRRQPLTAKDRVMRMIEDRGYIDSRSYANEYGLPINIARWHVSRVARQLGMVVARRDPGRVGSDLLIWVERQK